MISGNIEKFSSPVRRITGKVELFQEGSTPLTFAHDGDLISFVVDKTGENSKFFGFGVCQKIEVKIRDKDRQYTITDKDYLKPSLDDLDVLPYFYIKDVKRDENTNNLTLTAYDLIESANRYIWTEVSITDFTLRGIAQAIAAVIGANGVLISANKQIVAFDESYENGINVDGNETLRQVLDDIAEATQTIYYIDKDNNLVFKMLNDIGDTVYTIDKAQYFTLKTEPSKHLNRVAAVSALGDNLEATLGSEGEIQYVRDNMFWTLAEDLADKVELAISLTCDIHIIPFDCSWRGNYFLEIGDKIGITTKDDEVISTHFLNDKLTFNGGMSQHTQWSYKPSEATASNPTSLGEIINQTTAKVDKANKQIELAISEVSATNSQLTALRLNTDSINSSVSSLEKRVDNNFNSMIGSIEEINKKVSATMTDEEIEYLVESKITDGVKQVETTTGFTFNQDGLNITKSGSDISTTITEDGMTVSKNSEEVLTANNEGVKAIDLHAETFLVIGKNSRFEDYGDRTGCFWIGR